MNFIIKLLKLRITKIILSILFILFIASLFFCTKWYITQYHKAVGFYYVNKGDKAYREKKYQKAVEMYRIGLKHYPGHSNASCNLGNIYVSFENYYEAVNAYENALKYSPNYMVCRMDLAIILSEKMADYDKAIQEYGRIINTNPLLIHIPLVYNNKKSTHTNKGYAYYNMGLAYRGKAIYLGESSALSMKYLAEAEDAYINALKYLKDDFDTLYNLALTEHLLGDYKNAGINYCNAININPENYEAHYNFALLLRSMNWKKEALAEFEKTTTLISDSMREEKYKYVFGLINEIKRRLISEGEHDYLVERVDLTALPEDEIVYEKGKVLLKNQKDFNMHEFLKCTYKEKLEEL